MKCIIFGCGDIGLATYHKIKIHCEVVAWVDNNKALWGTEKEGIKIINPEQILEYQDAYVLISMLNSKDVVAQLQALNITRLYTWKGGFFYSVKGMYPLEFQPINYQCKKDDGNLHVLFISETAYIRDHKMASIINSAGHKVYLAYTIHSPRDMESKFESIYEEIFPIMDIKSMRDFIQSSNFDIIHSSSNPEYLTPILIKTDKPVIHDCHDLRSAYRPLSAEQITLEWIAHKYSDGVIYPTAKLRDQARKNLGIEESKTFVMENYISQDIVTDVRLPKLSRADGQIHCVYEGGLGRSEVSHKYFKKIWFAIASSGVHIHFYSQETRDLCMELEAIHPNIHYEGNLSSNQLAIELSKYDVGLCILNTNPKNKLYLECSSPNKIQEYINAGVPVAVGNIKINIEFVEENGFGRYLDLDGDIKEQIAEIATINIADNILINLGYTFEANVENLINFYREAIKRKTEG